MFNARWRRFSSWCAVTKMTGRVGNAMPVWRFSSNPSMPGMLTSVIKQHIASRPPGRRASSAERNDLVLIAAESSRYSRDSRMHTSSSTTATTHRCLLATNRRLPLNSQLNGSDPPLRRQLSLCIGHPVTERGVYSGRPARERSPLFQPVRGPLDPTWQIVLT
jgi:hypothetical protein